MSGGGADIWNAADQFRFAFKQLNGNGTLIAKVESVDNTDPWAKAGVMIRESLDPGARFAAVYATPGNGVRYQARLLNARRRHERHAPSATPEQMALKIPVWIKIERTGSSFSCFYSTDGVKWTAMSWNPQTINMTGQRLHRPGGDQPQRHRHGDGPVLQRRHDRHRHGRVAGAGDRRRPARQRCGPAVRDGPGQRRQEQDDQPSGPGGDDAGRPGRSGGFR